MNNKRKANGWLVLSAVVLGVVALTVVGPWAVRSVNNAITSAPEANATPALSDEQGGGASPEVEALTLENATLEADVESLAADVEAAEAALEVALENDDNYPVIESIADLPSDWDAWLSGQIFDLEDNGCDPHSYTANNWWLESTSEDGAKFDGNQGAEYDIVLREVTLANFGQQNESVIVWASSVQVYVYGTDTLLYEGSGPVKVTGPGRVLVVIQNGGYRVGVDLGGEFVPYWTEVLTCLYGPNWTPDTVELP